MCKVLKVSRSGYYQWLQSKPSRWKLENQQIIKQIALIHKESRQTYGSPRITRVLNSRNIFISRPRVARLMQKAKIQAEVKKRFIATTDSRHHYPTVENKLNREFKANGIGKIWVSDITYIHTSQGWLYLTIVMDIADRKIIGWSLSKTMSTNDTTIPAWRMAVNNRAITNKLIFHSDRGVQYACSEFKTLLDANINVIRSMSRKGDCWDNAAAESFFKTLKSELVYRRDFITRDQAALAIFEYIEVWYNKKRLHSSLGYRTPEEFEKLLANNQLAA
jgi:putative transposase